MQIEYEFKRLEENIITLTEVKNYLRVTQDHDNQLIMNLIKGAIEYAEQFIGKFIEKRLIYCHVTQAARKFRLKYQPFEGIKHVWLKENAQITEVTDYFGSFVKNSSMILLDKNYQYKNLQLEYISGFGAELPLMVKVNLMRHVAIMYENDINEYLMSDLDSTYAKYRQLRI